MLFLADIGPFVWPTILVVSGAFGIWYYGGLLATLRGSDVRLVWYLYSLGLTSTILIIAVALSVGAIDSTGGFHGTFGKILDWLMFAMIDLVAEVKLIGAIAALILVPQALSYLLSGLWGCAAPLVFVNWTIQFAFWSLVKFAAVGSGVLSVVVTAVWALGWTNIMQARTAYTFLGLALSLLAAAFVGALTYRLSGNLELGTTPPVKRTWMTRRIHISGATPSEEPPVSPPAVETTELVSITLSVRLNGEVSIVDVTPLPRR